jgi:hypothetical protein
MPSVIAERTANRQRIVIEPAPPLVHGNIRRIHGDFQPG